ncbi:CRAL-TRIO domain-containing protein [Circinella umbellata]|nr:CRAL-TRIO domain-containing protein [Circinella umbellata]
MLKILRERAVLLDSQYTQHEQDIIQLTERLKRDVELLGFSTLDLYDAKTYLNDDVTIFRFLRDSGFDETKAHEKLLDTIRWRQELGVPRMTYESVASEFFDSGGFAFFHKQDKLGRPVAVVQMRYFPQFQDKSKGLTDFIRPYACLVMEIVRKIMLDITCENRNNQMNDQKKSFSLVSQIAVIIDIGKAPFIPIDANLVRTIMDLMDNRFPGFIGSIYVMNFGWMYQGIWQMVKYILSDEARSRISFPKSQEVLEIISKENLLSDLGGCDDYQWSFETDPALQKYGMGVPMEEEEDNQVVPIVDDQENQVQSFTRISRSASISSDEFFDANETLSFSDHSSYYDAQSRYATPGYLTPLGVNSPPPPPIIPSELSQSLWLSISSSSSNNHNNPFYSWTGLHMGATFLTSFLGGRYPFQQQQHQQQQQQQRQRRRSIFTINNDEGINGFALMDRLNLLQEQQGNQSEQEDEKIYMLLEEEGEDMIQIDQQQHTPHFPHLLPPDVPQSAYALAPIRMQLQRIEHRFIRLTRRIFRLSFAYKGAVYWVIFYIFLRGPVEHALRRSLASVLTAPQRLSYTTIGITAAIAAAIGSSVTASVSNDDHNNRRRQNR